MTNSKTLLKKQFFDGEKYKKLRKNSHITRKEIECKTEIKESTIYKIEVNQHEPNYRTACLLADEICECLNTLRIDNKNMKMCLSERDKKGIYIAKRLDEMNLLDIMYDDYKKHTNKELFDRFKIVCDMLKLFDENNLEKAS